MCLLEGSWYRESSKRTSDWNPVSSTMVADCMSIAIILIRAWSMFLLRAHVCEYFCQVCAISNMVHYRRLSAVLRLLDAFFSSFFLWFSASLCWAGCFNFKRYKKRSNLRFMIKYWKALQTSVDNTFNRFDVLFACFTTSEQIVHFEVPTTSVDLVKKRQTALLRCFPASKFPDEEAFASRSLLAKIAF